MKHKLKIILLDLAYSLLISMILILTKIRVGSFLEEIKIYGSTLDTLDVNQNIQEVQGILSSLNLIATKAYLFIFVLIPLIIFVIYIIFQSKTLMKDKFSYKNFILFSLIPFVFLTLTILLSNLYTLILFIITGYLTFVLYFYDLKKIKIAFNKIYKLFPMYLVYLILPILSLGFFYLAYTRINVGVEFLLILLFAVLFSIIFSLYKSYLLRKLN